VVGAWGWEEVPARGCTAVAGELARGCTAAAGELAKGYTAGEAPALAMRCTEEE